MREYAREKRGVDKSFVTIWRRYTKTFDFAGGQSAADVFDTTNILTTSAEFLSGVR